MPTCRIAVGGSSTIAREVVSAASTGPIPQTIVRTASPSTSAASNAVAVTTRSTDAPYLWYQAPREVPGTGSGGAGARRLWRSVTQAREPRRTLTREHVRDAAGRPEGVDVLPEDR